MSVDVFETEESVRPESTRPRRSTSRWTSARRMVESNTGIRVLQLAMLIAIPITWERLSGNPNEGAILDEFYVGKPSQAWESLRGWASDGTLWDATYVTTKAALIGFAIGCISGVLVGFTFGVSRFVNRLFNPFLVAFYSVPKLALAPLFLLWFGLGIESKIALVVTVVFFLVFFNTYSGVREVDRDLVNVLRVMGASRKHIHTKVTFPAIAAWVIAGLRVSVPYAFIAAVVAEMISANVGLGVLIQRSSNSFNPSAMFAAIAVLVALSMCLNGIVVLFEHRVLRWRPDVDNDARHGI